MKITVYPSDKGDCLLLTGKDGKRILCDGGMGNSYSEFVAPELARLTKSKTNEAIDVVYVSHIDADHIAGVLRMLDDMVLWAIHDHKTSKGLKTKEPEPARPPMVKEIWHNGFRDSLEDNEGAIADQLAANALVLSGFTSSDQELTSAVNEHQELASSVPQAIALSKRIGAGVLGIPHNRPAKGKLMMVQGAPSVIKVGGMSVRILGPFEEDLLKLREEWNDWLEESQKKVKEMRAVAKQQEDELASGASFVQPLFTEANTLATALTAVMKKSAGKGQVTAPDDAAAAEKKLGAKGDVTAPNIASLTLLVTEGDKTVLLTGDAHSDEILKGLRHHGFLKDGGGLHVDVLKVQHHGSEHNLTEEFAKAITADHYVFCGDGFSSNPEEVVVRRFAHARQGAAEERSANPEVNRVFTFWFNSSGEFPTIADRRAHMRKIEDLTTDLMAESNGKMRVRFLALGEKLLAFSP